MNIGVDLDGVVFDSENYFRAYGELLDIEIGGEGMVKPDELKAQKRYSWDEETRWKYLDYIVLKGERDAPVKAFAREVLQKLKSDGHKLIVITSRGCLKDEEIEITKSRVKEEGLEFDKMYFSVTDKYEVCKQENVDVMIDDYIEVIDRVAENGIKALYYRDAPIMKSDKSGVTEVASWGEIYREILKLSHK